MLSVFVTNFRIWMSLLQLLLRLCFLLALFLFFSGDIISTAEELKNMSVNPAADKEKQKSEVKHLLVQKQRALTELFKSLATTGAI